MNHHTYLTSKAGIQILNKTVSRRNLSSKEIDSLPSLESSKNGEIIKKMNASSINRKSRFRTKKNMDLT